MFPLYAMVMGGAVATPPTVTSVNKGGYTRTQGGILFTITGTLFTGATGVTFGGTAATSVTVVNATTITCVSPAKAAGLYDVAVTTPAGTGTLTNGIEYVNPTSIFGANLKRWYSQTYAAGVWTDASGTANTSQATSGKRPSASTLAGTTDRPATHVALLFDGVDDGLNAGGAADIFTTAGTVAAVVSASVSQNAESNIFAKNFNNEDLIFAANRSPDAATKPCFGCGGSTTTELAIGPTAINDGVVRRMIGTLGSSTSRLYVNGTLAVDTGAGAPPGGSIDFNSIGSAMTSSEAVTDYHFTGKIAEVVVANVEANATQRAKLDAYLRDCAGLAA